MHPDLKLIEDPAKQWIAAWQGAAAELERMRIDAIRKTNTADAIRLFDGLLVDVLKRNPPAPQSGLLAQQRIFARFPHE